MLQAVPDEYDQRIRAAEETAWDRGHEARAAVVVAMEAARGAAIMRSILPGAASAVRNLPEPSDYQDSWRWVQKMADSLPRGQVAWLLHATPDRVHHAVIGAEILHHASVHSRRKDVTDAIDALMACCWDKDFLEQSIADEKFDLCLDKIAWQIGLGAVIPDLPSWVHRIAIVAGGDLAEIPFAALTIPGSTGRIGLRYALSDLPCLSARFPLAQRSHRVRGDQGLLIRPPAHGITTARPMRSHTVLDAAQATAAQLRATLELRRHRQLRIDTHGVHDPDDQTRSWLQLAPAGREGRLTPDTLQRMDLRACGTVVLGACESGMARRIGRDERTGFVRAALHAGAASVVAARWVAEDTVAAAVLDGFDRYVRYLPRDVALQRAQHDVYTGAPGIQVA
ncbi:MAG: CHAT domain-containing protein, partial [Pseudonocardiaceae bacterium]